MKVLIAPDSFKESLSAQCAASAMAAGVRDIYPEAQIIELPIADGGEGTVDVLLSATLGRRYQNWVKGPMGKPVAAEWGILGGGGVKTAVIETAAASGLALVPLLERNPCLATSHGTGELILAALDKGVRHIILGLGGSATNDAAVGLLIALGAVFKDVQGDPLLFSLPMAESSATVSRANRTKGTVAEQLLAIQSIDLKGIDPRLADVSITLATDVDNPMTGERGATTVFSAQKGASGPMQRLLEQGMLHLSSVIWRQLSIEVSHIKGGGAAGGIGAVLVALLNAKIGSGIDIVLDRLNYEQHLQGAALVMTGEGRIDNQSIAGKAIVGVARRAMQSPCCVIALAGSVADDIDELYGCGVDAVFPILPGIASREQAFKNAALHLRHTTQRLLRLQRRVKELAAAS